MLSDLTEIGHKLLQDYASEYLRMAAEIALYHHERYDGHGYPKGVKGREIPLAARIVAVAEAFHLLTSAPNCNPGDVVEAAMGNIMSRKGADFDPVCVEALNSRLEMLGEVLATGADPE